LKSQATDSSFSGRMARRRLGGQRVVSEMGYLSPLEELRRRMNETSPSDEITMAMTEISDSLDGVDVTILPSPSQRPSSPLSMTSAGAGTIITHPNQAKLGLGKALPAIASNTTTVSGKMSDLSSRLGSIDRRVSLASVDVSGRNTPAGSTAHTIRATGGNGRVKNGPEDYGDMASFSSTYEGNDPYIRAHLEAIYYATFRDKHPIWGPTTASNNVMLGGGRRRGGGGGTNSRSASSNARVAMSGNSNRRPEGTLIAYFTEHTASITSIAISFDHAFFLSGSEDGTIKVWDTARLEKNVTSKSRATYSSQGGKITALIMLEGSHCAASAASDGSVHVIRVDISGANAAPSSLPKYGKIRLISNFQLSNPDEHVTCLLQSSSKSGVTTREAASNQGTNDANTNGSSTLILATSKNRIIILDLRTMQVLSNFQIANHYGSISTLCLDTKNIWLLIGTIGGVLCLWDLRFHLLLKAWRIGEAAEKSLLQINSCVLHPSRGKGKWVMVAYERLNLNFEGEENKRRVGERQTMVETWDIETAVCVERYDSVYTNSAANATAESSKERTSTHAATNEAMEEGNSVSGSTTHSVLYADRREENIPAGIESAAQGIERLVKMLEWNQDRQLGEDETEQDEGESKAKEDKGSTAAAKMSSTNVKVLLAGLEGYTSSALHQSAQIRGGWLDAARLVQDDGRNGNHHGNQVGPAGYLITGGQDRKIRFWDLGRAEKSSCLGIKEERGEFKSVGSSSSSGGGKAAGSTPTSRKDRLALHYVHQMPLSSVSTSLATSKTPTRSPLIMHQQTTQINALMKAHKDTVTALAMIESPFRCIVAGDQAGTIRVWE
jgi:phosphoinositide-3-kinase regulatory subunit 4